MYIYVFKRALNSAANSCKLHRPQMASCRAEACNCVYIPLNPRGTLRYMRVCASCMACSCIHTSDINCKHISTHTHTHVHAHIQALAYTQVRPGKRVLTFSQTSWNTGLKRYVKPFISSGFPNCVAPPRHNCSMLPYAR